MMGRRHSLYHVKTKVHILHLVSLVQCCAGTYKASMVQAFQRTVKEARFAMVIVDAPNLSLDDLKMYWAAGQVSRHKAIHMQHPCVDFQ